MFIKTIFYLLFMIFCSASFASNKINILEDDLDADNLCGEAPQGVNPCLYVKNLNFYIDGYLPETDSFDRAVKHFNDWVYSRQPLFSKLNIRAQSNVNLGLAWVKRPKEKDKNIEITLLLKKMEDNKSVAVIFYSFSRGSFSIATKICYLNEGIDDCLAKTIDNLLEENVIKSITKNRK